MALIKLISLSLLLLSLPGYAEELVVVVNKDNAISALSKQEVIDIYMGRYVTFPDGKNAKPLDLPARSSLKNEFYLKLVNQNERKINAYWARLLFSGRAKPPVSMTSVNEVLGHLRVSEFTLAYIPESELIDAVKVVYRLDEN
ncbi:hypothetical protein [Marinomonas transparens]|uniref:Phosphate ABC transporter substrate-binding protein n=1 Tax=Marinomonas transparens TaxID=2795388 RepID=A0A934N4F1_9GAMM|nr:hypothetical protein [Marinomonas transparens]MBJ7540023.1 hypothetical protein [Marinomonas transparens]